MVTIAEDPLAMLPRSQVIVPTWSTAGVVQDAPARLTEAKIVH
jgi:hypothetical protein